MKKIVVIGGGFAGSLCAQKLQKKFDVTLIDAKDYFEFTPGILRTIVEPEHLKRIQILHKKYLIKTNCVLGHATRITNKSVFVEKKKFDYDYLIITTGSMYTSPFKEENMILPNRGPEMRDYNEKVRDAKKIVVVGGGLVGVELAAEIICKYPEKDVVLYHSHDRLIQRNNPDSSKHVENFLRKRSVEVKLNEHFDPKQKVDGFIFVCTGIEPNFNFKLSLGKTKNLKSNKYLQLIGRKNIFIGGDITTLKEEKTAQNAGKHARLIVKNIKRLEIKRKLKSYKSNRRGFSISLGKNFGILEYKNFVWFGRIPALFKGWVEKYYMFMFRVRRR